MHIYIYFLQRLGLTGKVLGRNPKGKSCIRPLSVSDRTKSSNTSVRPRICKSSCCCFATSWCWPRMLSISCLCHQARSNSQKMWYRNWLNKYVSGDPNSCIPKIGPQHGPNFSMVFSPSFQHSPIKHLCWNLGNLSLDHISAITFNHQE